MTTKKRRRKRRKKSGFPLGNWWKKQRRHKKRLLAWLAGIVALLFVVHHFFPNILDSLFPSTSYETSAHYDGIDISKYQGKINWKKVKANRKIKFVYIKATEGASLVDKTYRRNIDEARKNGLKVGSYHFFTSYKTPEEQYKNFKRQVKKGEQDLLPMVDVEEAGNKNARREVLQQRLWRFMELVKDDYGEYPVVYSQYKFYNDLLAPEFNNCIIFIARYGKAAPALRGGGEYNIWQYTERGKVDGIRGYVDLDRFENGTTLDDLTL